MTRSLRVAGLTAGAADLIRRYPALCLGGLAIALGAALVAPVALGAVPSAFLQLGALSASAAGIILAAAEGGRGAVRELLGRGAIWRVGVRWWLFALFFPIVPAIAALYLTAVRGGHTVYWSGVGPVYNAIFLLLFLAVFAGLGEEFGWRGFALPRLQRRASALAASLIVGALHAAWHLPLFFIKGELYHTLGLQAGFLQAFLGYALLVTALSVQLTWLFNNTRGSVLLVAVYHGAGNAWNGYLDIYRGQMANLVAYIGLMLGVSALLVLVYGPATLSRAGRGSPAGAPPSRA